MRIMVSKLSFGIRGLDREVARRVKKELPKILNKQAKEALNNARTQLEKLNKSLSPEDSKIIHNEIESYKRFHLRGKEVDKLAKKAGQSREEMAECLALESVLKEPESIIKSKKAENSRAELLAMMKRFKK